MQGGSAVAAVFRAHSRLSHLGTDGSGSEPTNTAVAPISANNSRRLRSRSITVSPPPCLASEKSACLSFSTRVNSQELHEKPAFPIFFIFGLTWPYRCILHSTPWSSSAQIPFFLPVTAAPVADYGSLVCSCPFTTNA